MSPYLPIYQWVRNGANLYLARVSDVRLSPMPGETELVSMTFQIERALYGQKGEPIRRASFERPADPRFLVKGRDPVWGNIGPRKGSLILLITGDLSAEIAEAMYAEEVNETGDPMLNDVIQILDFETSAARAMEVAVESAEPPANQARVRKAATDRRDAYVRWLSHSSAPEKLFAGEALGKDELPEIDVDGRIAVAFAKAFASEKDNYVAISLATWMWNDVYPRTNDRGRAELINRTGERVADPSPDVAEFATDRIAAIDSLDLHLPDVLKNQSVVRAMQSRLDQATLPPVRRQLEEVIAALRGPVFRPTY